MPHTVAQGRTTGRRQVVLHGEHRGRAGIATLSRHLGTEVRGDPVRFRTVFDALSLGCVVITRWRHSPVHWAGSLPQAGAGTGAPATSPGEARRPFVRLFLVVDGAVHLSQGGAEAVVEAGAAGFLRGHEEFSYEADGDVTVVVCDISAVDPLSGPVAALAPRFSTVAPGDLLVSAVTSLSQDLLRHDVEAYTPAAQAQLAHAVVPLLGSVLTLPQHRHPAQLSRQVRRAQIVHHVCAHHAERELTTSVVAARFGLSERSLQRLFEGQPHSVNELIHTKRTEHSVALLRDPRYDSHSVKQLAEISGFGSVVAFRRAVAHATGLTPTSLRTWERAKSGAPGRPRPLPASAPSSRPARAPHHEPAPSHPSSERGRP